MKCLIFSTPQQCEWVKKFFPGVNPYFLKYLNKPLLEYYLDLCVLVGISDVRVINNESASDLEEYFENGRQWGINLSYGFAKPEDDLLQVLLKNKRYCQNGVLLIYGYQFICYNKNIVDYKFLTSGRELCIQKGDCYLFSIPELKKISEFDFDKVERIKCDQLDISPQNSIREYYDHNMALISTYRNNYVLPGYNNEDGAYLGKNIIDKKSTHYEKPIVLGNNVQIQMNTSIGPNVILGNNVIIDHSTQVANSIIYDRSYIGSELEIDKKIVSQKMLIDPISEEMMLVVDNFLLSDIESNLIENSFYRFVNCIIAILLIILTTVPYILMKLLSSLSGMRNNEIRVFRNRDGKTLTIKATKVLRHNIFTHFFYRFSLDLYPLYHKVLKRKLNLVGNHLITQQCGGIKVLLNLPAYKPGVYSYAGSLLHNQEHENYLNDELEYTHLKSFFFDLKLIVNFWLSRLFSEWKAIAKYLGEEV